MVRGAKNFNNARLVGWATTHRIQSALSVCKDTPVRLVRQKMVAERVPKVSLVKQKGKKNAKNALLGFFNRKTKLPVHLAKNVHRDGINRSITRPVVLISVELNPRIVGTMNTGCLTKKNPKRLVVCNAQRVGHVLVQLQKEAFVLCLDGPSVQM
jgi:hypothetical protein